MTVQHEWQTLDEIIAGNVRRLRRDLTVMQLAERLGVSRALVYDMEGRDDRQQREFKWSDLVALCGALETTLFELVLPPEEVSVAGVENFPGIIADEPSTKKVGEGVARRFETGGVKDDVEGPRALSEPVVGRDGLSWRLFGMRVSTLNAEALKVYIQRATEAKQRRDEELEKVEGEYLGEISRIHEEARRVRAVNQSTGEEE